MPSLDLFTLDAKGKPDMAVLPDAWLVVMNLLIGAPVAWRSPAEVAAALARSEEETTDLLCDLDAAGWLVVWETDSGLRVTLSALAAERLHVRLVENGPDATPRWARQGEPDPPSLRSKNVCQDARAASLEFVADPALSPDLAAERGERVEAQARNPANPSSSSGRRDDAPRPTLLVGLALSPWPGPREDFTVVCPACGDRILGPHMYCLYCDRWGLDRPDEEGGSTANPVPGVPPARVLTGPALAAFEKQQNERLRARRKSKRQRRRARNAQDPRPSKAWPSAPMLQLAAADRSRPTFVPLHSPPPGKTSASAAR